MKRVIFYYEEMTIGGAEGLMLRLSNELQKRDYETCILTQRCHPSFRDEGRAQGITVIKDGVCGLKRRLNSLCSDSRTFIVTFNFADYAMLNEFTKRYENSSVLLYVVHPDVIAGSRKCLSFIYRRAAIAANKARCLLFMDEETKIKTSRFCKDASIESADIARIVIDEPSVSRIRCRDYKTNAGIEVLSIARADFPFKGYLIGLIKYVRSASDSGLPIHLTVVSSGDGVNTLKDEIQGHSSVDLAVQVPYEQLWEFYRNSDIYVGMGTTVIEAASMGIPVLPVRSYTYEAVTQGWFSENPTYLSGNPDHPYVSAEDYIISFLRMKPELRDSLGEESLGAFRCHYSLKATVDTLEKSMEDAEKCFSSAVSLIAMLKRTWHLIAK